MPVFQRASQGTSFLTSPVVTMLNAAACVSAAVSVLGGWVCWAVTFTSWTQHLPSAYFLPFFILMFPLFGWAVCVMQALGRRSQPPSLLDLVRAVPPFAGVLAVLEVTAAVMAASRTMGTSAPGQPEYDPKSGRYFYDSHGTLIPATRTGYLHAVAAQNQIFLSIALLFTSIAAAVTYAEWNRRRKAGIRARFPHPAGPRPKLPVPAGVLVLAAAIGLTVAVPTAALLLGRVNAYGGHGNGTYLQAGHPVRALLAPGHYVVFVGCSETVDVTCPQLRPAALSIAAIRDGAVPATPDPSSDHNSLAGQPCIGQLSFTMQRAQLVQFTLATDPGEPVIVVKSPGEQAHALAGWIALAGLSLIVVIVALAMLTPLLAWRLGSPGGARSPLPGGPGVGSSQQSRTS